VSDRRTPHGAEEPTVTEEPTVPVPHHPYRRMSGRDPHELFRVATPLELLFDLTFVVGFGAAASEFAHLQAANHVGPGLLAFTLATYAVWWAWVNFSWFASAFDTDDWVYRLTTLLQMVGVIILALGLPQTFASVEGGHQIDMRVVTAGYVVMRIAMVAQWLRAARQDPVHRSACLTYATNIVVAQIGWVAMIFTHMAFQFTLGLVLLLIAIELGGPYIAENFKGGTPWHAHHIVERYGLLTIIALGEGVIGTVASLSAVVADQGWTLDAVLVATAGIGLTFGMWWSYYAVPAAPLLHAHRERSFAYGYLHFFVIWSVVATGAGLHAAAYYIEHHSRLTSADTALTVALPVGGFIAAVYLIYVVLVRSRDAFRALLLGLTALVLLGAVGLAATGVSMAWCLIIVMLAPMVTVVGFEILGRRHAAEAVSLADCRRYAGP
jgi:low temperature requirement protein LtrA